MKTEKIIESMEKELLNRFGFTKDGGIDAANQLQIFSFLDWYKSFANSLISVTDEEINNFVKKYTEILDREDRSDFTRLEVRIILKDFVESNLSHPSDNVVEAKYCDRCGNPLTRKHKYWCDKYKIKS